MIAVVVTVITLAYAYEQNKKRASLEKVFKEQVRSIIRLVDSIRDRTVAPADMSAQEVAIGSASPEDLGKMAALVVGNLQSIDDRLLDLRFQLDAVWVGQFGEKLISQPVISRPPEVPDPSPTDASDTSPS